MCYDSEGFLFKKAFLVSSARDKRQESKAENWAIIRDIFCAKCAKFEFSFAFVVVVRAFDKWFSLTRQLFGFRAFAAITTLFQVANISGMNPMEIEIICAKWSFFIGGKIIATFFSKDESVSSICNVDVVSKRTSAAIAVTKNLDVYNKPSGNSTGLINRKGKILIDVNQKELFIRMGGSIWLTSIGTKEIILIIVTKKPIRGTKRRFLICEIGVLARMKNTETRMK